MKWLKQLHTITCAAALVSMAPVHAGGDAARGARVFGACAACHSLRAGEQLTGPSLAGVFGRRAGTMKGFGRYSEALRKADVIWNEKTLDAWLADPQKFIPGNLMTFPGIPDGDRRADLIAFLRNPNASTGSGGGMMGGMMTAPRLESLRDVEPQGQVRAIRYCQDSYYVTLGTGKTFPFWEFNLRFKTDGSGTGPAPGKPVILHAGMRGDRAAIVFASPDEISGFVKKRCE